MESESNGGKPCDSKPKDGFGQYNYQNDLQVVVFQEARVSNITYQLDTQNKMMSQKQAKEFAKTMIPPDATFIKEYDKVDEMHVLLYHSKMIESLFDSSEFNDVNGNSHPGEFDVVLVHNGDEVDSMGAMHGDNP